MSKGVTFFEQSVGAIFTEDQKGSPTELAFKYAVYRINKDKDLLPNTTLVYDIQYVPRDDSFRTSKKEHKTYINCLVRTMGCKSVRNIKEQHGTETQFPLQLAVHKLLNACLDLAYASIKNC
ncbi:hypothetical protein J437_LFUL006125 [Ladona fulva]|uniref:Uncharacterized protein n=1 Tax=Ladona fulva TaxID=123851 RepID=A0A8K0K0R7_LADFU|nr:hypothetical protein J437_LFUL006125 [Ladona fulva]